MSELESLIEADAQSDARLLEASARVKAADARVKLIEASKPHQQTFHELSKEWIASQQQIRRETKEKFGIHALRV